MRDIRADLLERIDVVSKTIAKAEELFLSERNELEARHNVVVAEYYGDLEHLNSMYDYEKKRHERLAQQPLPPHRAKIVKNSIYNQEAVPQSAAINSVEDAKLRLDQLSRLIQDYRDNSGRSNNVHHLPAEMTSRSRTG